MEAFFIRIFQSFSSVGDFANNNTMVWPIAEVTHFMGLVLLIGAIGVLDLRMLGMAKGLTTASVHRLVPVGILGFVLNAVSGVVFVSANTAFVSNPAFQLKMLFVLLAGINVGVFYIGLFRKTEAVPAGGSVPIGARIVAGVSLGLWTGVIITGRYMAWF